MQHSARFGALAAFALAGMVLTVPQAAAFEKADWLVRGRIVNLQPGDQSSTFATIPATGLHFDSETTLEFDFSYFPLRQLGLEMSTSMGHQDIRSHGGTAGMGQVADTRMLSATFAVQWHPLPRKAVRPYVGLGLNGTLFFNEDASKSLDANLGGPTTLRMDNSVGVVGQVGMDIMFKPNWSVNMDVKFVSVDTVAHFTAPGMLRENVEMEMDPWVFSTGVGYRF